MSQSSSNSECSIDSVALDYIPDYDIETKDNNYYCELSLLRDNWTALSMSGFFCVVCTRVRHHKIKGKFPSHGVKDL